MISPRSEEKREQEKNKDEKEKKGWAWRSPYTPRRAESLRRLKGYASPQGSCLSLVAQGSGSSWGWEERFWMTTQRQLLCGKSSRHPDSWSHDGHAYAKLRAAETLT